MRIFWFMLNEEMIPRCRSSTYTVEAFLQILLGIDNFFRCYKWRVTSTTYYTIFIYYPKTHLPTQGSLVCSLAGPAWHPDIAVVILHPSEHVSWYGIGSMLGQRCGRWITIKQTMEQRLCVYCLAQHQPNIGLTSQCLLGICWIMYLLPTSRELWVNAVC